MRLRITFAALGLALVSGCEEQDSCFAGDTRIATPRGLRAIRDLAVGDEIWSYDHEARRFAVGTIAAIHRARGAIRSVSTAHGCLAAVTESHPLYVAARREFVRAAGVAVGERLLHWNGDRESPPEASEVLGFASPAPGDEVEVFNLTVGGAFSTFFADGFYVHNKEPVFDCPEQPAAPERVTVTTSATMCIGTRGDVELSDADLPGFCANAAIANVVLATSNPSVLVIEGRKAIAVGAGSATVTALVDGKPAGSATITVAACAADAAAETATRDDAATDAPSDVTDSAPTDAAD